MTDAPSSSKMLKHRNLGWLVATLILDVVVLLVVVFPNVTEALTPSSVVALRASLAPLLPVPALILTAIVPSSWKDVIVFWRIRNPLPGSRAFTVHAACDMRIDLSALRRNVGLFPELPRDQNAKWYGLYKLVSSDPAVVDSHKNFLLFRDLASMSLVLVPAVAVTMMFAHSAPPRVIAAAAIFLFQYLVAAIAARTTGVRFVQNVLAIHATRKIARPAAVS